MTVKAIGANAGLTTQPYVEPMNTAVPDQTGDPAAQQLLRTELARSRRSLAAMPTVLACLAGGAAPALFSEEVIARTRGMIDSLAEHLLREVSDGQAEPLSPAGLAGELARIEPLLVHCHSIALEGGLLGRLALGGIDPVLVPLLQDLISDEDPEEAALAMKVLAAQSRFVQSWRRMELPLAELPAEVAETVLDAFAHICGEAVRDAVARLRSGMDEATSRTAMMARMLISARGGLNLALDLERAGGSMFVSALSLSTGMSRNDVVHAVVDGRQARLALLLAACGVEPGARSATLTRLCPDATVPSAAIQLSSEQARALLAEEVSV